MEFTGALTSVLPKLADLLVGEYTLQKGVKGEIMFLHAELESMHTALEEISEAPENNPNKIWAREVRELSYDMEDRIDKFMVRIRGGEQIEQHSFKKFIHRTFNLFPRAKIHRKIAVDIIDLKSRVKQVSERRDRYQIQGVAAIRATSVVDPRVLAMYKEATELVGIDEPRDELIKMLTAERNEESTQQHKIVSIFGFGGLGKTTLANAVFQNMKTQFDCRAFVSVSRDPDVKKLFKDMLFQLDKEKYSHINEASREVKQLIDEIREFLRNKRFLITIDDIWDISAWETIRCALHGDTDNDTGSRIIITTRIIDVAKKTGGAYEMKPLSHSNSKLLLYKRIFDNEDKDKGHDEQLDELSDKILKRCAGVPLAIITIASLLAIKGGNILEWDKVYKSMGTGLERNNKDVQDMLMILSLSYYDMPSRLRPCLLYLSVFPEDAEIRKDRLIWMWIAEGFIKCEGQGDSLFVLGERYFNGLINRSMIKPVYVSNFSGIRIIYGCRVHDMVLDLICSLSSEENFVTVPDGVNKCMSPSTKVVRRLSLQNSKVPREDSTSMRQVRSVIVFPCALDMMPPLKKFEVLRVLDLEDCEALSNCSSSRLKCVGNLLHLRYLGLSNTLINELPEVGPLRFLQILDLTSTSIDELPSDVFELRQLKCLRVDRATRPPKGIGKLASLEELSGIRADEDVVKELRHLTELRVLQIDGCKLGGSSEKYLVDSLSNMRKLSCLKLYINDEMKMDIGGGTWEISRHLRTLTVGAFFPTVPAWIKRHSLLLYLSSLDIRVRELQQEDLNAIGMLPALCHLSLKVNRYACRETRFVIGAGVFRCLVTCVLEGFVGAVVFRPGAMQMLASLIFSFWVNGTTEISGGLDLLSLRNLPSLQYINVEMHLFRVSRADEAVKKVIEALRDMAKIHPNHPTFKIGSRKY